MEPPRITALEDTQSRGFTLVEMVVVLAIISIITAIGVLGQSSFNRSLILTDTAYTLAFSIREAQALGLSSRQFVGTQNAGYGVHFSSAPATSYRLFADTYPIAPGQSLSGLCPGHTQSTGPEARPGNCVYENAGMELVRTYSLNRGFTIDKFCGTDTSGVSRCSDYFQELNIVYMRPSTQSVIIGLRNGVPMKLTSATIYVNPPTGTEGRCVLVSQVGQVAVLQKGETGCQ